MKKTLEELIEIADTLPGYTAIYKVDGFLKRIYYSKDVPSLTGHTEEEFHEMEKLSPYELILPLDRELVKRKMDEAVQTHGDIDMAYRLIHKNNKLVWVRAHTKYIGVDENACPMFLASIYDVTDEWETKDLLLEASDRAIVAFDKYTHMVLYGNREFFELAGADEADCLGKPCYDVVCGAGQWNEEDCICIKALQTGEPIEYYNPETQRYYYIVAREAHWGEHDAIAYFMEDITAQKMVLLRLQNNQRGVELAKKQGSIAIWTFNLDKKTIRQETYESGHMGYPIYLNNVPECFLEDSQVPKEDVEKLLNLYQRLFDGEEKAEETIRLYNHDTGKYDWVRICYQRIYTPGVTERMAVGFSINVNLQQKHLEQYQNELNLRKKIFENFVLYYQTNITKHELEEYTDSMNPSVANMQFPMPITEQFGQKILSEVEESHRDEVRKLFPSRLKGRFEKGETSVTVEYRRRFKDKGYRWVRGTAVMMLRPDTNDVIAFVYIQDIDREKRYNLALQRVLDDDLESVILMNVKDDLVDIVKENRSWKGKKEGDSFLYDKTFKESLMEDVIDEDKEVCKSIIDMASISKTLEHQESIRHTFRVRGKQERIERKNVRIMYLDEYHEDIVFVRRDITELYEEEQRNKHLLEQAIDEATQANEAKSNFFAQLSHDMRTPMNVIINMLQFAKDADSPRETREYLDKIEEASGFLLGLINDTLDISKIDSGKMELHISDYPEEDFVKYLYSVAEPLCREKKIQFILEAEHTETFSLRMDRLRINQMYLNLISNAVKYTPEGGCIRVYMNNRNLGNGRMSLLASISDNGIGMSEEFQKIMFEPYSQEKQGSQYAKLGTGLGLAIVKKLVDLMGCTIEVESQIGKGTTITLRGEFDIASEDGVSQNESEKRRLQEENDAVLKGRNVLVCEDHPMNQMIIKKLLENKEMSVVLCENGRHGVDVFDTAKAYAFDAVLMDIRMPVMDGLAATRAIRSLERSDAKEIPIIAMTANAYSEDVEQSLQAGMNMHLSKPIEPQKLYDALATYISKNSLRDHKNNKLIMEGKQ